MYKDKDTSADGKELKEPKRKKFSFRDGDKDRKIDETQALLGKGEDDSEEDDQKRPLIENKYDSRHDQVIDLRFEKPSYRFRRLASPDENQIWHVLLGEWDPTQGMVCCPEHKLVSAQNKFGTKIRELLKNTNESVENIMQLKLLIFNDIKDRISKGSFFGTESQLLVSQHDSANDEKPKWEDIIKKSHMREYAQHLLSNDAIHTPASIEIMARIFNLSVFLDSPGQKSKILNPGYLHVGISYNPDSGFQRLVDAEDLEKKQSFIEENWLSEHDAWKDDIKSIEQKRESARLQRLDEEEKAGCCTRAGRSLYYFLNFIYNFWAGSRDPVKKGIDEPSPPTDPTVEGTPESVVNAIIAISDAHELNKRESKRLTHDIKEERIKKDLNMSPTLQVLTSKKCLAISCCFILVCAIGIGGSVIYYAVNVPSKPEPGDEQAPFNRDVADTIDKLLQQAYRILPLGAAAMSLTVCCCYCGTLFKGLQKAWEKMATIDSRLRNLGNRSERTRLVSEKALKKLAVLALNSTEEIASLRRELDDLRQSQGISGSEEQKERNYGASGGYGLNIDIAAREKRIEILQNINKLGGRKDNLRIEREKKFGEQRKQDSTFNLQSQVKAKAVLDNKKSAVDRADEIRNQKNQQLQNLKNSAPFWTLPSSRKKLDKNAIHSSSSSSSSFSFTSSMSSSSSSSSSPSTSTTSSTVVSIVSPIGSIN